MVLINSVTDSTRDFAILDLLWCYELLRGFAILNGQYQSNN